MHAQTEHEHTLNVYMASLLARQGLVARPEVQRTVATDASQSTSRLDIEVRIGPAVVAVEAEHGQSVAKQRDAGNDADQRLRQGLVDGAIALCYPEHSSESSLPTARFIWSVRNDRGESPNWSDGDLDQLASVIRLAPAQLGNPDFTAATLSASLDAAVEGMTDHAREALAGAMDLPPAKGRTGKPDWSRPAKRALLVVATALMFHARLDPYMAQVRPERDARDAAGTKFDDDWPPMTASRCAASSNSLQAFVGAWDLILALDYKPIFQTARFALQIGRGDPTFARALRITADAALGVVENIAGLRHDLLGRIFHTVLDSARYDGSFYTTTAAATLLATLALDDRACDWSSVDEVATFRVTDPSCGTGTLLMAAAERIRGLSPATPSTNGGASRLDKALIEQVLTGFDVNLTATHLAATTLGLLSPTTQFTDMKIGMTYLGVDNDQTAYLGSLEFLDKQPKLVPWPSNEPTTTQVGNGAEMAWNEPSDLVIMNPPFTRDSLRHDQFSKRDEANLKAREKELFGDRPVHRSSNGNAFLILADHLIKRDRGTLAAILPLVTATNASSLPIREFLAKEFHVETIVTSHDPERIYFSENTTIGEMLIICRRRESNGRGDVADQPTRVINLARNPATPTDALTTAFAIGEDRFEETHGGAEQYWPAELIRAGDWGAVQFLSPFLCETFQQLKNGELFPVRLLRDYAAIGPGGRGIRGAFSRSKMPASGGMRALWDHKTDIIQSMAATTDTDIRAKPGRESDAERLWGQRGRTMLPTRLFLPQTRATAVRVETPAVGSAWVPCKYLGTDFERDAWEKAATVYLNSTLGILAMLGDRSNKTPSYPQLSISDLKNVRFPEVVPDDYDVLGGIASTFEHLSDAKMQPLPGMAACDTRQSLDAAVCQALDVNPELVKDIRRALSREPSITRRRYSD